MKQFILIILISVILNANETKLLFNTQEFKPFNYKKDMEAVGPVVQIIKKVCAKMGIKCEFKVLPWRRAQKEVELEVADALFVVGKNIKRQEWLYFSHPIIKTEYGFFVSNSNKRKFNSIDDIQGYNVGVYGPSNTSHSLNKIGVQLIEKGLYPIDITMSYDDILSFKMLNKEDRNIHAVYSNKDVGNSIIKEFNLKNIRYFGKQKNLNYYIAFSKKTVAIDIVEKFNILLHQMYINKSLQKILDQYSLTTADIK